jgi:ATP-dependent RNA helicase DDX24/MAK5
MDIYSLDMKQEENEDQTSALLEPRSKDKGKAKAQAQVNEANTNKRKGPPLVSIAAIVGGMSAQKQHRILDRGVDVLVATPGRLWDILQQVSRILSLQNQRISVLTWHSSA